MVPAVIVFLEELPLTAQKKVDRGALPAPEGLRPELEEAYVAPRNPMEEELARIWAEVLRIERVGIHDDFFELGGHSLLATQLISRVRDALSVELPLREIFDKATIAELAEAIRRPGREVQTPPIEPVPRDRELPLSFAQQRLWILDQIVPSSSFYNVPNAVRLVGRLNPRALRRTYDEIIRRHEVLRTSFTLSVGRPIQVIAEHQRMTVPVVDLRSLPESVREATARRLAALEASRPSICLAVLCFDRCSCSSIRRRT